MCRMTIDEAISEFKERVEDSKKISELGMKSYIPKVKEEEQLAEWLEELKELRNMTAGHLYAVAFNRGYLKAEKEVRNNAIDDFAEKVKEMYAFTILEEVQLEKMAEQLKAGGENENGVD